MKSFLMVHITYNYIFIFVMLVMLVNLTYKRWLDFSSKCLKPQSTKIPVPIYIFIHVFNCKHIYMVNFIWILYEKHYKLKKALKLNSLLKFKSYIIIKWSYFIVIWNPQIYIIRGPLILQNWLFSKFFLLRGKNNWHTMPENSIKSFILVFF